MKTEKNKTNKGTKYSFYRLISIKVTEIPFFKKIISIYFKKLMQTRFIFFTNYLERQPVWSPITPCYVNMAKKKPQRVLFLNT